MKKLKRIVSLFLACAIAVTTMCAGAISASAASTNNDKVSAVRVWSGKEDTSWYKAGKESYDISTPEQLAGLAKLVNEGTELFAGITVNLTNDIALNNTSNWKKWKDNPPKNVWTPIGVWGNMVRPFNDFEGYFNGNGHTISGLYVNSERYGGLFRYLSGAVVVNLKIAKSVIIAKKQAGALAGVCESTYIDGCEAEDVYVYGTESTGGLIGETKRIKSVVMILFHTTLLAFGIVADPLIFNDGRGLKQTVILNNCKVTNVKATSTGENWDPPAGAIVGQFWKGGIYNSISVNSSAGSSKFVTIYVAGCGPILGSIAYQGNCEISNCYSYGFTREDGKKEISFSDKVKNVSKKALYSSELAKKLGDSFTYEKNKTPQLKNMKDCTTNVILSGTKAEISWDPVKNAKKYKVYIKSNGKYKLLSTVSDTNVELNKISKGKSYAIMVRAIFSDGTYQEIDSGKFTFKA